MRKLKMVVRNTCEGVHLLVELPPISLQACKFTKNELLHTDFSMILGRIIIVFSDFSRFFSRKQFLEGGFTFQWGEVVSQIGLEGLYF